MVSTPLIIITPYKSDWPQEFRTVGLALRAALGDEAQRIDHIGSTAVSGLAAKDRIDVQVTVRSLSPSVRQAIAQTGFQLVSQLSHDHCPPGYSEDLENWAKWVFIAPPNQRPVNIHVRLAGRPNQRYALLFRDYLRANPAAAEAYAQVKMLLAQYHPDNIDVYNDLKDPVCDLISGAAELWAQAKNWQPGPSDC